MLITCSRVLLGLLGSRVLEGLVALAGRLVQPEQGGQLGPVEPRQQRSELSTYSSFSRTPSVTE